MGLFNREPREGTKAYEQRKERCTQCYVMRLLDADSDPGQTIRQCANCKYRINDTEKWIRNAIDDKKRERRERRQAKINNGIEKILGICDKGANRILKDNTGKYTDEQKASAEDYLSKRGK